MNTNDLVSNATFGLATYASLTTASLGSQKRALLRAGLAPTQADAFSSQYDVVTQFNDTPDQGGINTSFTVTVFADATGNLTVAFRGADNLGVIEPSDLPTGADIVGAGAGYDQIVAMVNWWAKASAIKGDMVHQYRLANVPIAQVTDDTVVLRSDGTSAFVLQSALDALATGEVSQALLLDPDQRIDVTGHSIGGHLAMAFSSLFSAQAGQVTVFDAPGFVDGPINRAFFEKLGGSIPTSASIINVIADEALVGDQPFSFIAGLHSRPGIARDVAIENQSRSDESDPFPAGNHAIAALADSLTVYELLADLDPTLDLDDYKALLQRAAKGTAGSYECIVDTLESLFGIDETPLPTGNGNREALYQAIGSDGETGLLGNRLYKAAVAATLRIEPSAIDAATLSQQAQEATGLDRLAYLFALTRLNTFVAFESTGVGLYARFQAGGTNEGELDAYDAADNPQGLTENYLHDRAAFLERKLYITTLDLDSFYQKPGVSDPGTFPNGIDAQGQAYQGEATEYLDLGSGFLASTGGPADPLQHFVFGDQYANLVTGANQITRGDHLYGGAGDDFLNGAQGDDYLEGGEGIDTYLSSTGDGADTLLDADGWGVLIRNGQAISLGIKQDDTHWKLSSTSFTKAGGDLEITFADTDKITIKDFDFASAQTAEGDLGIHLALAPTTVTPSRTIEGDLSPIDEDPNAPGVQLGFDDIGNVVTDPDNAAPGRVDTLFDSNSADLIEAGEGDDLIVATRGGGDWIQGDAGRDRVQLGGSQNLVEGGADGDLIFGGAGKDYIYGGDEVEIATAIAAGESTAAANGQGDLISGAADNDAIIGEATADLLFGGADSDLIVAGSGDDTIYGDSTPTSATLDWSRERVRNDAGGTIDFHVNFTNVDIQVIDTDLSGSADQIYGGAGADWIFAGGGDDFVDGGSGNDAILGQGGSDAIFGGAGDDVIDGDSATTVESLAGDDYIDGGADNDTIFGESGDDVLIGGSGDDVLSGGDGDDTLQGGVGEDILIGGKGKDTYIFSRGDGLEVVQDVPVDAGGADASILALGEGIKPSDVKFKVGSLEVDLGGGDAIHFNGFNPDDPLSTPLIDHIQFADGSRMSYQDILDQGFDFTGTDSDDLLQGTAVTDRIDALGGNDTVVGNSGDDVIHGDDGDDSLSGDDGNDTVYGDAGNDNLDGGDGGDTLHGGDGNDQVVGAAGDDVLDGGVGDDTLVGDAGSDTYTFNIGDGQDTIDEQGLLAVNLTDAGSDTIQFATGIDSSSVTLTRESSGDLEVDYGLGDRITVKGQYSTLGNAIEAIEFADGTTIDAAQLAALPVAPIEGTEGDDSLVGTSNADRIRGLGGNDTLDGGAGDDELEGGAGSDTYAVYLGMGQDTLVDASPSQEEISTLSLAHGLSPASLKAEQRGIDLFLGLRGTQDGILITGYFDRNLPQQNWQASTFDGATTSLDAVINQTDPSADIEAHLAMQSYEQSVLAGWAAQNRPAQLPTHALVHTNWSQTIIQSLDPLNPSLPQLVEVLAPITSSSIFDYGVRVGGAFQSVFPLGRSIAPTIYSQVTDDSVVDPLGQAEEVLSTETHTVSYPTGIIPVTNYQSTTFASGIGVVNTIRFTSGSRWLGITLDGQGPSQDVLTVGQDTIQAAVEEITAGDSNNSITGGDGQYHVAFIDAGAGDDFVQAGPLDFVYGGDGNDVVTGGNIVYGGNGDDQLTGGTSFFGGAGNDILTDGTYMDGGAGDDVLTGGDGATTFYVDTATFGSDSIQDPGGVSSQALEDWYYQQLGITSPDENRTFGGWWGLVGPTWDNYFSALSQASEAFHYDSLGVDGHFRTIDDLTQEIRNLKAALNRLGSSTTVLEADANNIRFIEPLPLVPEVAANDYAALQPLYDAGIIPLDTIRFGPGVTVGDLTMTRSRDGQTLDLSWGLDQSVQIRLAQADDPIGTGVERFTFADGTSYGIAQMLAMVPLAERNLIVGTDESEFLGGTEADDRIVGLAGDDYLDGAGGSDLLEGGDGDDNLSGGDGDDILIGGQGADGLFGGAGDDTFVYNFGDGVDHVSDEGGSDTILFGDGIVASDVVVTKDPYGSLYVEVDGVDNRLEIQDWFTDSNKVEAIGFADGTTWDTAQIESRITTAPATDSHDILNGSDAADVIDGLAGDDEIYGNGGNDILSGGDGSDYMEGGAGRNLVLGGEGDDDLAPGYDLEGNASVGANLFIGGAGDDFIATGPGANVVAFNVGDGADTLFVADAVTLSIGGGAQPADLSLSENNGDLLLSVEQADSILLTQFTSDPTCWPEITLQMFGSVHTYDFNAAIADFEAAKAADPSIIEFSLGSVLAAHEANVSTTDATGGALAWQYATTGSLSGISTAETQAVLSDPNFGVAPQSITLTAEDQAPTLVQPLADQIASEDSAFVLTVPATAFSDPDAGDTLTYSASLDSGSGLPSWLHFDAATATFSGTPVQADVGVLSVRITATDGSGLSASDTFTLDVANVNDLPVVSASDGELLVATSSNVSTLFSVFDEDGDTPTQYQFWDDVAGGGHFSISGIEQGAAQAIDVSSADLANTEYVAGTEPGTERVWVRANDGTAWGAWNSWNMTSALHIPDAAPEIAAAASQTVLLGQAVDASSLFSASDADGDPVVRYQFWDSTGGNGHFEIGGTEQGVNVAIDVTAADLANTQFVGSDAIATDLVWVRANDGQSWGEWKSWTMQSAPHLTNSAPLVTTSDHKVLIGGNAAASSLFSVADSDSDAITQYQFWDDVNGGGYWSVDGVQQVAGQAIDVSASDLTNTEYVAGTSTGMERVWVRASDGVEWSAWQSWQMTTALHIPNEAPVVDAVPLQTVLLNQVVSASAFFGVSDADSDTATQYEFWDSTAGNGHFAVNGITQGVNTAIAVSAPDLANTEFVGASAIGSDEVWVRVNDGELWSDWKSWTIQSSAHIGNSAPMISAADQRILTGDAVPASSLFDVSDGDSDAITQYQFWDDVNGGGYWTANEVQQAAAQAIDVSAADLANTQYVGGASASAERVWVRATDGIEWSAWKSWNMTTALHLTNAAPTVAAADQTILLNQAVSASALFNVSDADGEVVTQYQFWDSTTGNGHFAVNGAEQGVNTAIDVSGADLANTQFIASSSTGADQVWVRASDGEAWSDWKSWTMQSAPHLTNGAPVITATAAGVLRNEAAAADSLFSVSDVDSDAITQYQFWDDVNGGGGWSVNGVQQAAAQAINVSAADLANTSYVGGANPGTEQVWVRANDGIAWGAWQNWLMSTEGGMVRGGNGPDSLVGDSNTPVLEGGAGDDSVTAGPPNSLISGGEGSDTLSGAQGNDLVAGGAGNDTINTGGGDNVIAFNAGGGSDIVNPTAGGTNALSLGGGIDYNDLSLCKDGNDLILNAGGDDHIILKDWYADPSKDTVLKLQVILDASNQFDANSSDPLLNKKVETFDFLQIVDQFDQAMAQTPGLSSWAVTNALLQAHLSGSDGAALGGDLTYWYGKNGGFTGISLQAAEQVIGAAGFATDAQQLHAFSGLQDGFVKLA